MAYANVCMRNGCSDEAVLVPVLRVPAQGWPINFHTPCQVVVGIKVCKQHFLELKPYDLITPDMKNVFQQMLKHLGKAPPDFARADIIPMLINSDEYRKFKETQARPN